MIDESWFGGSPAVGQLSADEQAAYLRAVDDPDAPPATDAAGESAERFRLWGTGPRPFEHTGSAVGYIQRQATSTTRSSIRGNSGPSGP